MNLAVPEDPLPELPFSDIAEQAVIGILLMDGRARVLECADRLSLDDFYLKPYRDAYESMLRLARRGVEIDVVTVFDDIHNMHGYAATPTLSLCISDSLRNGNLSHYAGVVKLRSQQRAIIRHAQALEQRSREDDITAVVEWSSSKLRDVAAGRTDTIPSFSDAMGAMLDDLEARAAAREAGVSGMPSGLTRLDRLTGGFEPGQLIVAAGRTSSGKTSLGLQFARHAALKRKASVLIFSLEMPGKDVCLRIAAQHGGISLLRARSGDLRDVDWSKLTQAYKDMHESSILVEDAPAITVAGMSMRARHVQRTRGLDMVIVDYLGLVRPERRAQNRTQEVSEISAALKSMARELSVPVLALSQLNRAPEKGERGAPRRPQVTDLRDSGAVENDADIVLLLHRPGVHDPPADSGTEDRTPEPCELIIAKQRNGPLATISLMFEGWAARFVELTNATEVSVP